MVCFSFHDGLRKRVEKVRLLIERLSEKFLELMIKFNVKTNGQSIRDGHGKHLSRARILIKAWWISCSSV
jgi:hypothetical protein